MSRFAVSFFSPCFTYASNKLDLDAVVLDLLAILDSDVDLSKWTVKGKRKEKKYL